MSPSFGGRGCPRGQTLPSSGAAGAGTAQVPAARCPPGGVQHGSRSPSLGALGNPPLQSNSLPACMCAFVRNVRGARVPGAQTPLGSPTCEPLPSHPLEKKLSELPGMKSRAVVAVKTIQQAGWYILELR